MLRKEKEVFVQKLKEEAKKYKTIGIARLERVPDSLLQKMKNELKGDTRIIVGRKKVIARAIENEKLKETIDSKSGNFAIILSNKDPFELNEFFEENSVRLFAKPNQISENDIIVEAGETSLPPGQMVSELKNAGINAQIQKGKVVISETKTIVKKGEKVSKNLANALRLLNIAPFSAKIYVENAVFSGTFFDSKTLSINSKIVKKEIEKCFTEADALAYSINMPTPYNISRILIKSYLSALYLGVEKSIYVPTVIERLILKAMGQAMAFKIGDGKV
ncbi:MAG: 50S ribosomal protein L10 [Candidatus Micrarchaeaceae archaeon]